MANTSASAFPQTTLAGKHDCFFTFDRRVSCSLGQGFESGKGRSTSIWPAGPECQGWGQGHQGECSGAHAHIENVTKRLVFSRERNTVLLQIHQNTSVISTLPCKRISRKALVKYFKYFLSDLHIKVTTFIATKVSLSQFLWRSGEILKVPYPHSLWFYLRFVDASYVASQANNLRLICVKSIG